MCILWIALVFILTHTHTRALMYLQACAKINATIAATLCMVNINMYANKIIILTQNSLNEVEGGRGVQCGHEGLRVGIG